MAGWRPWVGDMKGVPRFAQGALATFLTGLAGGGWERRHWPELAFRFVSLDFSLLGTFLSPLSLPRARGGGTVRIDRFRIKN